MTIRPLAAAPAPPSNVQPPPINESRLVDTFLRLVTVPGPSLRERPIADQLKAELASLNLTAREDEAGERLGGNAGNLIVDLPGNVPGAPSLLFACHMDTVPVAVGVKPVMENGKISSDGTTALGGDNRAGCAEVLEAVREVLEHNLPHGPIQLVFTVAEERGLLGASELDPSQLRADYAYAVDVFKANQIYTQGRHLLLEPDPITPEVMDRLHRERAQAPIQPPDWVRLTPEEKQILEFTAGAMQDVGLKPEFRKLEWGGTDAIALRQHGINAISLGAGENNPHTRREFVLVEDMVASTRLIRGIIARAAAQAQSGALAASASAVGGPVGAALKSMA
ncbi:MAG: M20/M25/M40 family metallo-hydrolase [Candidatus Eremiobacterota bacterium]